MLSLADVATKPRARRITGKETALFDVVCCVSLRRRQDRWDDFTRRIPAEWPFKAVARFPGTDGQLCSPPSWWAESAGAWGCLRSHLRVIGECLNNGYESVLIFEDDAVFPESFVEDVQTYLRHLPDDWQMAYLGGQLLKDSFRPPQKVNDWVYRPFNVNRTHAYAVRGTEMLSVLYQHLHARDWFEKHHIDHHYGRLHQTGQYGVYVPRRWLVGQLAGASDVSGENTDTSFWNHAEEAHTRGRTPFVAVLGLHESASSAVAVALHHLGVHMGDTLGGADPRGGGEDQALTEVCEKIAPFPTPGLTMREEPLREKLEAWLGHHMWRAQTQGKIAGGKYPHLCALGPYFKDFCGDMLQVIDVQDSVSETTAALQRRLHDARGWQESNYQEADRVQRWLAQEKARFLADTPHLSIDRATIRQNPESVVRQILGYLQISPADEQIGQAVAHLREAVT